MHRLVAGEGRNGTRALQVTVKGQNDFNPIGIDFPRQHKVFARWYYRFLGTPEGNVKGMWFKSNAQNRGEIYGGSVPGWSLDYEGRSLVTATGMYYGLQPASDRAAGVGIACERLADGQWHRIEVEYNRNAGPNVELRVWCDGKAAVHRPGPGWITLWNEANRDITYVGGSSARNEPTILRARRTQDDGIDRLAIWEVISSATGSAELFIDDVAVSTRPIGP